MPDAERRNWIRSRRFLLATVGLSGLLISGGAAWALDARGDYLSANRGWLPWSALILGVSITGLLVLYLNALGTHAARIEKVVIERTHELSRVNRSLAQEITERRRTETVLKDSEALYSSLVESLPLQVMRKNLGGDFTFANRSFCDLLARPVEEILGKNDFDFYPPDLAQKYRRDDRWVAETGQIFEDTEQYEKGGEIRYVHVMKSPVRDAAGKIVGIQVVFWDVTAEKTAEEHRERAKAAAEAANRAKSTFLASMSHEIRTPLNAILGMTELVLDTPLSAEQREYLAVIRDSGEALLSLVSDVLDFSKIEAGKLDLERTPFDIHEGLGDTLRLLAPRAHQKGLELVCDIRPGVPEMVIADAGRLRQVIVNLVGNAIKFTDQGEVLVAVECQSRTADQAVLHFSIADTGIGIAKDKQEAVFGAFVQGDAAMTQRLGGTGLGLAISSRLVELTGGGIWVDSELGRGSTFHFTTEVGLPQAEPAPLEPGQTPAPQPSGLLGLRVLVVDDNATSRGVIGQILRNWEMEPTLAASAAEATERLCQSAQAGTPYPLLLVDAAMPQTDGFALVRDVRRQFDPAPAVIMLLASGSSGGDISRCEQLGVSAYVLKPIKQSESLRCDPGGDGRRRPGRARLRALGRSRSRRGRRPAAASVAGPAGRRQPDEPEAGQALLERQGHMVIVANDGQEGVAAARTQPLDLILIDIQMPRMDGLEATAAIRQAEKLRGVHVPIIAMTAHAMQGDRQRCLEAGMDDYLAKPIRSQRLFETIAAAVAGPNAVAGSSAAGEASAPGQGPPPVPSAGNGVVDWPTALQSVEGDLSLLRSIVTAFLDESPRLIAEIGRAITQAAPAELVRPAHTLKGSLSYLGARRAGEAAFRLERMAREGQLLDAGEVYAALQAELERVTAALRDYLL